MDNSTFEQFLISRELVGDLSKFLKEGMELILFSVLEKPLYIESAKLIDYKVSQTGGSDKGNTVGASFKDAILENGLVVKVPLFIKVGEKIKIDTRTGEYAGRS
jgi:elongation factor P